MPQDHTVSKTPTALRAAASQRMDDLILILDIPMSERDSPASSACWPPSVGDAPRHFIGKLGMGFPQ